MVRIRRSAASVAVLLVLLCASLPRAAGAQQLARLTVQSFALSSDTPSPQVETAFHLFVSVHVRERVAGIANLQLPVLSDLELLGDERHVRADTTGTDYREIITVIAHHTGRIAIAPATLQAIDARDGRPKEFYSNSLVLNVTGGALEPLRNGEAFASTLFGWMVRAVEWTLGIACAIALVVLFARRRRPIPVAAPAAAAPPAPPLPPRTRTLRDGLSDALTVLRAEPTRGAAVRVRSGVWHMIGAGDGETLADVLQRPQATDPRMREVLRALERAAFTYDSDVAPAIEAACASLERYLA